MRAITSVSLTAALTLAGLSASHSPARAQVATPPPPAGLGHPGQTIITSELALDYQRDVTSLDGAASVTTTSYDFHVGFDRVVWSRLTAGGRVGFAGVMSGLDTRKGFDVGARVGGLVPVGGGTLWWPSLGLNYDLTSYADRSTTMTVRTVTLVAAAPFLWQPVRHLLIGVGPTYAHDLQAKTGPDAAQTAPTTRGFGVHGFLGLWF